MRKAKYRFLISARSEMVYNCYYAHQREPISVEV